MNNSTQGSMKYYFIVTMNSICVCAVDVFIIISGFYSCLSNKINFRKPIQLIVQVIIFQLLLYIGVALAKGESIRIASILYNFIPRNYYVTLYISLMLISPFLNNFISKMSKDTYRKFLIILIALFLVEPTVAEIVEGLKGITIYEISTIGILGAEWGYTIVTFVCLYFIAAYIRKYGSFWLPKRNLIIYFASMSLLVVMKLIELRLGNSIGAEHYMNPILVVNAIAVFEIFRSYDFRSHIVNAIAKGCFTVFILHAFLIKHYSVVQQYLNSNIIEFIVHWMGSVVVIFVICDLIGIIYTIIEKIVFDFIQNKVGFWILKIED